MSEVLFSASQVGVFSAATSPEEAAQIFLGAVSKGLAAVIAEKLDEALRVAAAQTAAAAPITGWNKLIQGCAIDLCWERPKLGSPVGQVVAFAPRTTDGVNALAGSVSVGISISATF
jgi:cytochrome c5